MAYLQNSALVLLIILCQSCASVPPPKAVGPTPSDQQLAWQDMEFYGFIHFSINTFTDDEWGYGDKSPDLFNPSELDARQWARIAKEAGMKGLILTNKHHDGFCLWPSEYTDYSVKNSPWKNGKGDVVKELAEACREYGLKMGIYLSPWDRNHPDYGKPEYIEYFRNQLTELLTNYGDIFEVWFDGANGGDGYYGGAREIRTVDKKSYYDWKNTIALIRKLQPNAIIWSDSGPDARWVGNEHGYAYETTWSPLLRDSIYGGMPEYSKKYAMGQENGTHWVPAEADVSIRPGWYYHKSEDNKVKTLKELLEIYYKSVGQNSTLLLNLPVDRRGLVHENDERQLKKLMAQLKEDFATNLALNAKTSANHTRGNTSRYKSDRAVDSDKTTYWTTNDDITNASITIDFGKPTLFNRFLVQEYIPLGQRVTQFSLDAEIDGIWKTLDNQTTIGYKRILRLDDTKATKIRLNIEGAKGSPIISNIAVYHAPLIVDVPKMSRNKQGLVSLQTPEDGLTIYYTLNSEEPSTSSSKYLAPIAIDQPTTLKTFSIDPATQRQSDVITESFDISKKLWKITTFQGVSLTDQAIDENPLTDWSVNTQTLTNYSIDLGETTAIKGFTYTPTQGRWVSGVITHYSFYGSMDGENWTTLSEGEFSNIIANPIQQKITFSKATSVRYIRLVANKIMNDKDDALIAEIGVITK
ncbi:alpha-L-fucosidase [Gelidibacter salicanalis]|uniref:alpha-L-fucosidase n=1 Tax=Gelidibacter salicanalis TaxID=291193 RepID=A0A934KMK0_9FLAO|nr:alpha-L-fucosidase [Gelidibacter salicanalis]MBJ7882126.1 alpha-L-fucosidase [Gelidibacter salicanalis]